EVAAQILEIMARLLPALFAKFTQPVDDTLILSSQNEIAAAFMRLEAIAAEASHERLTRFTAGADPGPLLRTVLRLHHDLVMVARAALVPLPEAFHARLAALLARVAGAAADYLRACISALRARRVRPRSMRWPRRLMHTTVRWLRFGKRVRHESSRSTRS